MTRSARLAALGFAASILIPGAALAQGGKTPDYQAIVAAPDRSDADRQTDQRRQPAKMLAFTGVSEGMKVLDMEANAGYSTELLARAVGPDRHGVGTGPGLRSSNASSRTSSTTAPRAPAMKNVVHVIARVSTIRSRRMSRTST